MNEIKIGDRVWIASYETRKVQKECPVCFGNKEVTLRLGNGDEVLLDCDYCGHGFHDPTGYVTCYERTPKAEPVIVQRIASEVSEDGTTYRYHFNGMRYVERVYTSQEEALVAAHEKAAWEQKEEDERTHRLKRNVNKSFAWNAGYHLREAAECRRRAERHDRKAVLCKARIPTEKKEGHEQD